MENETVLVKKEDYDLLCKGCERLLELENQKPVAMDPDMFSGLNAMLKKEDKDEDSDEESTSYDVSDLTLENNIS